MSDQLKTVLLDLVASLFGGGGAAALIIWLGKNWITERIQQSIRLEHAQKLEDYKTELNKRIQAIEHENQSKQLHTQLFFDHQREAFAALSAKIYEVNSAWTSEHFDVDAGLTGPVPTTALRELHDLYQKHQLFLDGDCVTAMELVFDYFSDSCPTYDGTEFVAKNVDGPFGRARFLQPLVVELFRTKIGVTVGSRVMREIAMLGAMRLLNKKRSDDDGLTPLDRLRVADWTTPGVILSEARENFPELLSALREVQRFLRTEGGSHPEDASKVDRFLAILEAPLKAL